MAGRSKHTYRSKRSHKTDSDMRSYGLYRMSSVVNRKVGMRNVRGNQKKGDG